MPVFDPQLRPPHARSRLARAFTLLETMLAIVLGSLVILASMALFRTVERSDKRSQMQLERNMELATAHTTIARAFHMLLMSGEQPPNEKDTEEFLKQDDERNSTESAEQEDEDAAATRMALQPDSNNPITMTIGPEGRQRRARSQTFRLTLRDSPVLFGGEKSEEQLLRDQAMRDRVLLRAGERITKRASGSGSSRNSDAASASGAIGDALAMADKAAGGASGASDRTGRGHRSSSGRGGSVSGDAASATGEGGRNISLRPKRGSGSSDSGSSRDELTASERLDEEDEERPRAPGVRGVLELLPDGMGSDASDGSGLGVVKEESDQPTYSLWWRELPPLEIDSDEVSTLDGGGEGGGSEDDNSGAALSESRTRDSSSSRESSSSRTGRSKSGGAGASSSSKSGSKSSSSSSSSRSGSSGASGRAGAISGDRIDHQVEQLANSSDSSGKRVRLLSGLTTCHWTAFRGRKERDKITAKFDRHLPAFVELEFVTAAGRRENWVFDVAWTVGAEPGSVVPETADPLNGTPTLTDPNQNNPGELIDTDGDGKPDTPGTGGPTTAPDKGTPTGETKGGRGRGGTGGRGKGNQPSVPGISDPTGGRGTSPKGLGPATDKGGR